MTSELLALNLSEPHIQKVVQACVDHLQKYRTITVKLMKGITDRGYDLLVLSQKTDKINLSHPTIISSKMPRSPTPSDHPEIQPSNKVPSATLLKC